MAGAKPPWRPKVAGWSALLCGPIAGALVAAVSFRRMGQTRKATQTVLYTLAAFLPVLFTLFALIPADAGFKRIIGIAIEGAGFSVFPSVLRKDFLAWKAAHPGVHPRNDYAAAGWGMLGLLLTLVLLFLLSMWDVYRRLS